jgi:DNA-binding CsgD family transcriptional regulator
MQALKASDKRKIVACVREFYSLGSLQSVAERAVGAMQALIDGNSALVCRIDAQRGTVTTLADSLGPELVRYYEPASALKHEHPGFRYDCDHPNGGATALADVVSSQVWKRTGIYNEVCSNLGMHEQLGAQVPFGQPDYFNLVVNRSRRSFTERNHGVLNILRHHVGVAFRTATASPSLPSLPLLEALESVVGGSLIAVDLLGAVQFSSKLAQEHLEAFVPEERPFHGGLPSIVRAWVNRELAAFTTNIVAMRPRQSLVLRRGDTSLHLRLASSHDATAHVVVLRVQGPACDIAKLRVLGFGRRPTEVLYWMAQGKTNEEIGIILGIATQTVKGHLKPIFVQLGVENRASAGAAVSALLTSCGS